MDIGVVRNWFLSYEFSCWPAATSLPMVSQAQESCSTLVAIPCTATSGVVTLPCLNPWPWGFSCFRCTKYHLQNCNVKTIVKNWYIVQTCSYDFQVCLATSKIFLDSMKKDIWTPPKTTFQKHLDKILNDKKLSINQSINQSNNQTNKQTNKQTHIYIIL